LKQEKKEIRKEIQGPKGWLFVFSCFALNRDSQNGNCTLVCRV